VYVEKWHLPYKQRYLRNEAV